MRAGAAARPAAEAAAEPAAQAVPVGSATRTLVVLAAAWATQVGQPKSGVKKAQQVGSHLLGT